MSDATETPALVNKAIDWQSLLRINLAREATLLGVGSFMVVIYQRKAGRHKQKNNKKQVTAARQERGANDNLKTAPVTGAALTSSCLLEEQDIVRILSSSTILLLSHSQQGISRSFTAHISAVRHGSPHILSRSSRPGGIAITTSYTGLERRHEPFFVRPDRDVKTKLKKLRFKAAEIGVALARFASNCAVAAPCPKFASCN
jgi:hypothetical protein